MAMPAQDKYYLRTLHQEIDLFDRKLAHMLKYGEPGNATDRTVSEGKLTAKRELLVRTARRLAADGVEFKVSELPRSFRTDDMIVEAAESPVSSPEIAAEPVAQPTPRKRLFPSPYAGTMLDPQADIEAYKRNRTRTGRTHS